MVTHGRTGQVGDGLARLVAVARGAGVELLLSPDEATRHGMEPHGNPDDAELVVVPAATGRCSARSASPSAPASP